jgi:hypothetical protein
VRYVSRRLRSHAHHGGGAHSNLCQQVCDHREKYLWVPVLNIVSKDKPNLLSKHCALLSDMRSYSLNGVESTSRLEVCPHSRTSHTVYRYSKLLILLYDMKRKNQMFVCFKLSINESKFQKKQLLSLYGRTFN